MKSEKNKIVNFKDTSKRESWPARISGGPILRTRVFPMGASTTSRLRAEVRPVPPAS